MQKYIMQTLDAIEQRVSEISEALAEARIYRMSNIEQDPDFVNTDEYTDSMPVSIDLANITNELLSAHQTIFKYLQ